LDVGGRAANELNDDDDDNDNDNDTDDRHEPEHN